MRNPWACPFSTRGNRRIHPVCRQHLPCCYCCDVLEHVRDLPKVIGEIFRVTKPGGVFHFDTLNRTFISKPVAIKTWQEWKSTAFVPPRLHEWRRFIRPDELKGLLVQEGFWLLYLESDTKSAAGGESSESFWLMRKPTAGRAPGKVLRLTAADDFHCAWKPTATSACILSHVLDQAEVRHIVFYALDPVRGKGNQLAKLPFTPSQLHNRWGLSPDGSHLALLNRDKPGVRILVIAVADGGTDTPGARGTPPACRRLLEERKARPRLAASLHPACASRKQNEQDRQHFFGVVAHLCGRSGWSTQAGERLASEASVECHLKML